MSIAAIVSILRQCLRISLVSTRADNWSQHPGMSGLRRQFREPLGGPEWAAEGIVRFSAAKGWSRTALIGRPRYSTIEWVDLWLKVKEEWSGYWNVLTRLSQIPPMSAE